jgi:hypothetical protein
VTQGPADGSDGAGEVPPQRLELVELQIAKLWELFTRAARLDTSVDALRDEVRFLTSMWQQIHENDEVLQTTRTEVSAVQRDKADGALVRRVWMATVVAAVVLFVGVGVVGFAVKDVRDVARRECVERQAALRATIARERHLARTDVMTARAAHTQSADTYERLLHPC